MIELEDTYEHRVRDAAWERILKVREMNAPVCELCGESDRKSLTIEHIWQDRAYITGQKNYHSQITGSNQYHEYLKVSEDYIRKHLAILCYSCQRKTQNAFMEGVYGYLNGDAQAILLKDKHFDKFSKYLNNLIL